MRIFSDRGDLLLRKEKEKKKEKREEEKEENKEKEGVR